MTTENRRHLARVRNAFLGATALAGFAALSTPAQAIVINDSLTPAQAVDTTNITGVGQMVVDLQNGFIGLCTVSLINPRTVIFASHCVNENPAGTGFQSATGYGAANGGLPIGFFFNANNNVSGNSAIGQWLRGVSGGPTYLTRTGNYAYNSNFVVYDKQCCTIGIGNNFLQADVAMAALDTPAVGIPMWTVLFSPLSAPVHATITGYGDNGIGSTGQGTIDYKRRVAENVVSVLGSLDDQDSFLFGAPDGLPANLYMMDFNDPKFGTAQANIYDFNIFHDKAYPKEGITAPGDSGGPLIIDHTFASPTIAAVLSGGDRFYFAQKGASYGTTSFYQPLYLYWDWIVANNPYKYVTSTAGNHNWTDADAFVMALDPSYLTISGSNTVNALPTTPAQGIADVAPGFGTVCYFDVCVNIKTGVVTNPTPPAGPNPASGTGSDLATVTNNYTTTPFGGALGLDGFLSLAQSMAGSNGGLQDCGAAIVSANSLLSGDGTPVAQACATPSAAGGGGGNGAHSDWTNPEGTALVAGVLVQGAPGASVGQVVNDVNANVATLSPARYYDVTIGAAGTITLPSGTINVDKVTVNGPSAALTIAPGATLGTYISFNSFAGTTTVNGTLNAPGGVNVFGGVIQGNGTINGPTGFLIGAVAPGTNGTVGTLTINGAVSLGIGSTTAIDVTGSGNDLLQINGTATIGGTLVPSISNTVQATSSYVFLKATGGITGGYNAVTDTLPGVLFPVATKTTVGGVDQEVLTFQAGSFVTLLNGAGTPDQTQIAAALDAARGSHYNDLLPLYQAIDPLSGAALGQALENLAPDIQRSATLVGDMQTTGFDGMIWQHLGDTGAAGGGTHTAGMLINGEGLRMALASAGGTSAQSQQLVALGMGIATNPGAGNDPAPVGVPAAPEKADDSMLMLPNGMGGYLSGSALSGSVAIGGSSSRADIRGLVIGGGIDMPVEDGLTVGVSFAYSDATATPRAIPSVLQSDAIQGALYARYDFGENYIAEAYGAYGHQTISTHRTVVVGASTFNLTGHSGGGAPSGGISFGRSFTLDTINGAPLHLVPSFSLQYLASEIDPFTETGGAPAMTFMGYSESSGLSRLGLDADMTFDIANVNFTPSVHMAWVENFSGNNGSVQSAFAGGPSSIMTFAMPARDRSYGELGLGIGVDLGDVLGHEATLSGRYDGNTRSDIQYGAWTGRLSIKF